MSDGGSRPVPDPTILTTQAVDALRKELTELFDAKLGAAKELTAERFSAVSKTLATAEDLRLEQKVDTKTGLDAALAAQKESAANQAASFAAETAKTERNFTEQLKGQRDTFGTAIAAQVTRYDDLDKRMTRMESVRIGGQESRAAIYAGVGFIVMLLLTGLTVVGFIAANQP